MIDDMTGTGTGKPALDRRVWARRPIAAMSAAPALFTMLAVVWIASAQGGYFPTSWGWSALALLGVFCTWAVAAGETDAGRLDAVFMLALVLLITWVGLSITWSSDPAQSVLELERWLVPLAGCAAFLVLARRTALRSLTLALVVAIASISVYSLATRLVPDHFGVYNQIAGYRLSEPMGYWNALGIFTVIGILLALGLATERGAGLGTRAIGAASLVVLPVTLYFSFSRGSWVALAFGIAVTIAASKERLRLATESVSLALIPSLVILLASHSTALTDQNAPLSAASRQGHRLGAILIALATLAALSVWVMAWVETHARLGTNWRRAYGAALVTALACMTVGTIVHFGGPVDLVKRGYDSFVSAPPTNEASDLNNRLLSFNGNGRVQFWQVAINAAHGHWLGGTGAGSFERSWDRSPTASATVRDAHSLYVETLSELGIVGLVLLALMLGIPLVAGLAARTVSLVPAIVGSYTAFLVHNGVDWDWELSGIALTGLLTGSLLLVVGRQGPARGIAASSRSVCVLGALAAAALALVAAIGNGALARAEAANQEHRYAVAESQARLAHRWMPWSADPLLALGEAQLESGEPVSATASFRRAISIDRRDWQAWLDLAASTQGSTRRQAIARAHSLYPRSPEITEFESELSSH